MFQIATLESLFNEEEERRLHPLDLSVVSDRVHPDGMLEGLGELGQPSPGEVGLSNLERRVRLHPGLVRLGISCLVRLCLALIGLQRS